MPAQSSMRGSTKSFFGAYDPKAGAFGSLYDLAEGRLNHTPNVLPEGSLEAECAQLFKRLFPGEKKVSPLLKTK